MQNDVYSKSYNGEFLVDIHVLMQLTQIKVAF